MIGLRQTRNLGVRPIHLFALATVWLGVATAAINVARAEPLVSLPGMVSPALSSMHPLSTVSPSTNISLAIVLPIPNQSQLDDTIESLYDPASPDFHRFLTPTQFADYFCPSAGDYASVKQFALRNGLSITRTSRNRLVLDVSGRASAVNQAFHVHLVNFAAPNGKRYYGPDADPQVPASISGLVQSVVGLDNADEIRPHFIRKSAPGASLMPRGSGSGPFGSLIPSDIISAYDLSGVGAGGTGQSIALLELDGYTESDIQTYESQFELPNATVQNVLIDGFNGLPSGNGGEVEVSLDIELALALSPTIGSILVYEAPNTDQGLIDDYTQIADDDLAKQVSTSWGLPETEAGSLLAAENTIFEQMAAQGQSVYAAAGDSGAYDDGSSLSVDDPASQPYVCGVGGTSLTLGANQAYGSESAWGFGAEGGGGGESVEWSKPSWQSGCGLSLTKRNVPDVSLNADPNAGYDIYVDGAWEEVGGTSCGAPLWASFTALVNGQRSTNSLAPLGLPNPAVYRLSEGIDYASDFHDIADNSANLYFIAVPGYDNATGLGSFNGAYLFADLSSANPPVPNPQPQPTGLVVHCVNSSQTALTWTAAAGATSYNVLRAGNTGGPYAYVGSSTTPAFTDTALTLGQTYYYVVTAQGPNGVSANSVEEHATVIMPPGTLTATAITTSSIQLAWAASTGATFYNVERGNVHGGPYVSLLITHGLSFTDTNLTAGKTYFYVVTATTALGTSPYSNEASAATICTAPSGLYGTPVSTSQITVTWNNCAGATGYNLLRSATEGGPFTLIDTTATLSFSDTGLAAATSYYYVAQAINANSVVSADSAEMTAETLPPPPTNLIAKAVSATQIQLTWTASPSATSYIVLQSATSGGPYSQAAKSTTTACICSGLNGVTPYYFVVQAVSTSGTSTNSAQATATTLTAPPLSLTAAASGAAAIDLAWKSCTGATGYVVFRGTATGGPYAQIASPSTVTYADTALAANTAYFYVVESKSAQGDSTPSIEATATTLNIGPTKLAAVALSSYQVSLTWTQQTGCYSYVVERGTVSGGPYTQIGSATHGAYVDTSANAGTTYYYVVYGSTANGASTSSNEASATTPSAAITTLVAYGVDTARIGLRWSASAGASGYTVLRSLSLAGPYSLIARVSTPGYIDTGLDSNTSACYIVDSIGPSGVITPSNEATGTTLTVAPAGLISKDIDSSQVNLTWNAVYGAGGYEVFSSKVHGGPFVLLATVPSTSYEDVTAQSATTYFYVVAAVNPGGLSAYSNVATATTLYAPPYNLVARAATSSQINLTWAPAAGATEYEVLRSLGSGGPYVADGTSTTTSYSDTGLKPYLTYYYVVAAIKIQTLSPYSNQASATTLALPPPGVTATAMGQTEIELNWNNAIGETGYAILRSSVHGGPYTQIGASGERYYYDLTCSPGTTYFYVLRTVTAAGSSANSTEVSATTSP